MNEKLQTVGVRLPQKLIKQLRFIASYREWTLSQTARKLIEEGLSNGKHRKPGPKREG